MCRFDFIFVYFYYSLADVAFTCFMPFFLFQIKWHINYVSHPDTAACKVVSTQAIEIDFKNAVNVNKVKQEASQINKK